MGNGILYEINHVHKFPCLDNFELTNSNVNTPQIVAHHQRLSNNHPYWQHRYYA